ncbi:MAG: selenocysteine-specific translation elongation factor [Myxococcales bacterium]|nr:selenocysteine-specific translation elongation factor [Myxococcales bacterium]
MQTYPIILGTAGHIDHGKTSLVKALTGIDTDRLKVEKERGITTELGFAHLDLQGRRFGLVDVPGHERFIKAMVAGAGGLDLVCLVIAADEGIMPQTREHLDICELLGVRLGVIALSKRDLVDEDWLELVTEDVREELEGSFLEEAPIVPISTVTGAGMEDLKETLVELTKGLATRSPDGRFRMPVDRIFTVKGFGTVVTGTVISGNAAVGDEVLIAPWETPAKIRGLQVHGGEASKTRAGMRCAMNLAGVSVDQIGRGDVVVHPSSITPSHIIDVKFRYLKSSKAKLKTRSRVLIHHGTTQRMATLVLVDKTELVPGEEVIAQLRMDASEPLVALPGDRFIARGFVVQQHYGTTIGGGEIVRVQAPKARRSAVEATALLTAMSEADTVEKLALEVMSAKSAGRDLEELAQRTGLPPSVLGTSLQKLVELGTLVRAGKGKLAIYMHAEEMARLEKLATDTVAAYHENFAERRGMPKAELITRLPSALPSRMTEELLATLLRRKALEEDQEIIRRPGKGAANAEVLSDLEQELADTFVQWGNTPEKIKKVAGAIGADDRTAQRAMQKLLTTGVLVKVSTELYLHANAVESLRASLQKHFETAKELTPGEWKEIVGASRKFTIPLAEFFDKERLTLRVGDVRKWRGGSS